MHLFDATQKNTDTPHGRDGYYIAEHGELSMYELGKAIGGALVAAGKIPDPETTIREKKQCYVVLRNNSSTCSLVDKYPYLYGSVALAGTHVARCSTL